MSTPAQELARDLNNAGLRALGAGDLASATDCLQRATLAAPGNAAIWLNLAAARRAASDVDGALAAVDAALKINPASITALLMRGSLLERQGERRKAVSMYTAALTFAATTDLQDAATRQGLAYAADYNKRYRDAFADFLRDELAGFDERGRSIEARRIRDFIDLSLGRKLRYQQEPSDYCYPGLPSIPFYDREIFPWLCALEAGTAMIRAELEALVRDDLRDFFPYVALPEGVPANQWAELNRSTRWSAMHLYVRGVAVEANCRRCPNTVATLRALPLAEIPGRSPAAMFSALHAGTHIPPHAGVSNTRLIVHLPLIVPPGCTFRVGGDTRDWREGEAWVFDDSIEHEAWNRSDCLRVILIFDVWSPFLNETERALIQQVVAGMDRFDASAADVGTGL